jgi:hypothetical protein
MRNQQMPEQPTTAPTTQAPPPPPGPVIGVSRCVMSIARELDRLPAGHYVLSVDKPVGKKDGWQVSIDRVEKVREMDIVVERNGQVLGTHLVIDHDHNEKHGNRL